MPGGRLRLARALWRLTAAHSGSPITAQEYALRWWGVCRSLLERGRRAEIADDLDQMVHRATRTVPAEVVSAAIAHHGPAFRAHADGIRRERDGLNCHVPRPRRG